MSEHTMSIISNS